jgi:leucyl aminopeptidase (aminopeptidase T)
MNGRFADTRLLLGVACLTGLVACACDSQPKQASTPLPAHRGADVKAIDYDVLAERVVGGTARVSEGDFVQVNGTVEDSALMEALAIAIRRRGAFPLLTLTSERLERRMFERVPEKYDSQPPALELELAEKLTAVIDLVPESEEIHEGVAPERIARVFESRQGLHARERQRGLRQVFLGNELYPSPARAKRYGMSYEALARNYWRGLSTETALITDRARWLREKLVHARVVEVTNPNGTHVTMSLSGRKLLVSDGVLSDEKIRAGGEEVMVWLPAGEVYAAPVAGTINGTVVVDQLLFQDTRVESLRVQFVEGRVAFMTAKTGLDSLKRLYGAAGPGKDRFSALDVGINPNVEQVPGAWITSPAAAGMVTLGIGRDTWAGGDNNVSFGIPFYLPGSTLSVDGDRIIVDGRLALPESVR